MGIYVELSELVGIVFDKETYKKGETIDIITTNIDVNTIILEKSSFTIYQNRGWGRFKEVFSKSYDDTIELEYGENFTWSWDQKNENGEQVSFGEYAVSGEFLIQGINRTHRVFSGFFITFRDVAIHTYGEFDT